jgi:hypothetical protein
MSQAYFSPCEVPLKIIAMSKRHGVSSPKQPGNGLQGLGRCRKALDYGGGVKV